MQPPPVPTTVPDFVRAFHEAFGPRPLIALGEKRITYAEASLRSAQIARGLLACGLGKGTRIGVWMPNGPDWVVAWLAAARIGCVVVPINTFSKPRELRHVLHHADVHALLMARHLFGEDALARLEASAPTLACAAAGAIRVPELPRLRQVFVWGGCERAFARSDGDLLAAADATPGVDDAFLAAVEDTVSPADAMLIVYTSGSTADPKGAIHSHGSVLRHSQRLNAFRDLRGDDRIFSPMPYFWVGGLVFTLLSAMHLGAFLVCEEPSEPGATLALLERERVTFAACWPHQVKALLDHPSLRQRDLSSLRAGNLYALLPSELRPQDPELRPNSLGMTE